MGRLLVEEAMRCRRPCSFPRTADRAQYYPQPYTPHPHVRTKNCKIKGVEETRGLWHGVVLGSMKGLGGGSEPSALRLHT